jgi:hypothetical protein
LSLKNEFFAVLEEEPQMGLKLKNQLKATFETDIFRLFVMPTSIWPVFAELTILNSTKAKQE